MTGYRKPKFGEPGYVGYKFPPQDRQFKSGKSGNPKGRPKGSKNDETLYEDAANQRVTGRDAKGRTVTLTAREAAYRQLLMKAASGSAPHLALFLRYEERFGWLRPPPEPSAKTGVILVPMSYPDMEEAIAHIELEGRFAAKRAAKEKLEAARDRPALQTSEGARPEGAEWSPLDYTGPAKLDPNPGPLR